MDVATELEELVPSEHKRRRRKPPRLAVPSASGIGPEDGDCADSEGQRKKGRPAKPRLPTDERDSSEKGTAKVVTGSSDITEIRNAQFALAKTQIIRLRYAAADCGVRNYSDKVSMILSPQLSPKERWNTYIALANEVDDELMLRGLEPVFKEPSFIRSLLPLFSQSQTGANTAVPVRNGSSPRFKRIVPADSSSSAGPAAGASKAVQPKRHGGVAIPSRKAPAEREGISWNLHTLGAADQRISAVQNASRPAMVTKKHAIDMGKDGSATSGPTKKRAGDAARGGVASVEPAFSVV